MAVQQQIHRDSVADAEAVLRQHGVLPDASGAYTEATLAVAIAERGWIHELSSTPGAGWIASVDEVGGPDEFRGLSAGDPDRTTALLKAVVAALGYLGAAHEHWLEAEVRQHLGVSKEHFLQSWRNGEFDAVWRDDFHPDFNALSHLVAIMGLER